MFQVRGTDLTASRDALGNQEMTTTTQSQSIILSLMIGSIVLQFSLMLTILGQTPLFLTRTLDVIHDIIMTSPHL